MSPKLLRVLFVEDSEDDMFFTVQELKKGGFAPEYERAQSLEDIQSALDRKAWDVIISDHSMPGFSSFDVLKVVKQQQRDIPVIIVSGVIGEETAVKAMKAGASDYVMKASPRRLVPSIERELVEAANRRVLRKAEDAGAYLCAIVDSSEDAIIGTDLDGTIQSWNRGAARMYGYTTEEATGQSIKMLKAPARPEESPDAFTQVLHNRSIDNYETFHRRKDGEVIPVSVTRSPIIDNKGKVIGVSAIERDITRRKQEEHERLFLIQELSRALSNVKTLRGLLPICATCKKVRDDQGYWNQIECYVAEHTQAEFTHGICPGCQAQVEAELETELMSRKPASAQVLKQRAVMELQTKPEALPPRL